MTPFLAGFLCGALLAPIILILAVVLMSAYLREGD